jgi:hypothetical protein
LLFVWVPVAFSGGPRGQSKGNSYPDPPYRLLASGNDARGAWYVVSVQTPLRASGMRALVCEVVRQENPENYRVLGVGIFVDLDSWIAPVGHGDTELDRKQDEHRIGDYIWNVELPHSKTRLHLVREHRFDGFNHLSDCKK